MHFWISVKSKPCKSKSQKDDTSHPSGWLLSKKGKIAVSKDREIVTTVLCWREYKWCSCYGFPQHLMVPQKVKHRIVIRQYKNSPSRYIPKGPENGFSNRYLYPCSEQPYSQKPKGKTKLNVHQLVAK